ncbi:MAG: SiaC family regulatory phosphoprotein, partial [Flavobacteriales bacterium]
MQSLDKSGNDFNPQLSFNAESGMLRMSGKSIPLDSDQILAEITTWLEAYSKDPKDETKLEIDLSFLNGKSL